MQKHDWIIEVCEDLKKYAQKHKLLHLVPSLDDALNAARHEALLQTAKATHDPEIDFADVGDSIGFCKHFRKRTDEPR